jgi:hypothetical protein
MSNLATLYRDDVAVGTYQWRRGQWRRWSGRRWARASFALRPERLTDPRPFDSHAELDRAKRDRLLEIAVDIEVLGKATVLHRSERGVTLGYPHPVNHVGHAVLTVLTGGLWGIVWIVCSVSRREDRVRLEVDPWGNIWPVAAAP